MSAAASGKPRGGRNQRLVTIYIFHESSAATRLGYKQNNGNLIGHELC